MGYISESQVINKQADVKILTPQGVLLLEMQQAFIL